MKALRVVVNGFIAVTVVWVWMDMLVRNGGGRITGAGLDSLRYFTWLSNTWAGLAAVWWLLSRLMGKGRALADKIKYAASVSVGLTFLTVIGFLGPVFGFHTLFRGSGLWFHLIIPLIAVAESIFLNETALDLQDNVLAVLPVVGYGVYYLVNIAVNGIRRGRGTNDLYGFFTWGWFIGALILAALVGAAFLIGFMLRKANGKIYGR